MKEKQEKRYSCSYLFYNLLIKFYIPFEAKYVSLRGKKDNILIMKLIRYYMKKILPKNIYYTKMTIDDFRKTCHGDLKNIFENAMEEYVVLLYELMVYESIFLEKKEEKEYKKYKDNNELDKAIIMLEKKMGINQYIPQNKLENTNIHIDSEIYKNEIQKINNYVLKFGEMYDALVEKLEKEMKEQNDRESNKYSDIEILFFVVSHEFLNFLSHYSTAKVFFNSPRTYIDNLNKGSAHLKRGLMDIYDGLIALEKEFYFNKEFLLIRAKKVNSLGHTNRMKDLVEELDTYYKKVSK